MSVKELELATPTTSDLSHDETIPDPTVALKKQHQLDLSKMSAHNLSTPVASPPTGAPIISATAVEDVALISSVAPAPPAVATAASPVSAPPTDDVVPLIAADQAQDDDDDDDDEDDDLFNEPEDDNDDEEINNDLNDSTSINNINEATSIHHNASDIKSELVSQSVSASSSSSATSSSSAPLSQPAESLNSKRALDDFSELPEPVKRPKLDDYLPIKEEASTAFTSTAAPHAVESTPYVVPANLPYDPRDPPDGAPRTLPKHQIKFALASIRAVKRLKDAAPFVEPVDDVKLNIPTYYQVIKTPMDLLSIERKLTEGRYTSVSEFIHDVSLIVSNCVQFNGPESFISNMARNIKASFDKHMNNMPLYDSSAATSNSRPKKKAAAAAAAPIKSLRVAAQSLPSVVSIPPESPVKKTASAGSTASHKSLASKSSAGSGSAPSSSSNNPNPGVSSKGPAIKKASPVAADVNKPFALQPSGMPTIRRDSTVDGRPKREIHPPKSKDLPYGDFKPRKKKYAAELRFCGIVLKELQSKRHETYNFPFLLPVDPVALNCPSYFKIIKSPMDLSTIQQKYNTNQYETAEMFEEDVRLMFRNCYKFNPEGSPVNLMGHRLEALFDKKWHDRPMQAPSPPPISVDTDSEDESDVSDSELIRDDPGIKYLEAQLERMKKDLEKMKREALQKAREARDVRRKKKKRANGSVAGAKKGPGGKAASAGSEAVSGPGRRKSTVGGAGGPGRRASNLNGSASAAAASSAPTAYVTYEMKEELSRMCQTLPEKKMRHVLKLIQEGMPSLDTDNQEEVELEIDQLNPATVLKLYDYVVKTKRPRANSTTKKAAAAAGGSAGGAGTSATAAAAASASKRKGKPISEAEQTRQIEQLQRKLQQFDQAEEEAAAGTGAGDMSGGESDDGMSDSDAIFLNDGATRGGIVDIGGGHQGGGGHGLSVSASGAGMALAGLGTSRTQLHDSDDDDDDDDGASDSSSEEE